MRFYTAHLRHEITGSNLLLVKEGFCWQAFIFSILWALWHRLWLVALVMFALQAVLGWGMGEMSLSPLAQSAGSFALALIFGIFANDFRRWTYERRDYRLVDVVGGGNLEDAERRLLDELPELAAELRP
ncbi:MAG: DUF2628 domain-containing protein [Rhodospirillales bacterium]|jgi:hypothetical protein|nr:DUF2628 domain-containing protein [Rhodospirillales bacterium]HIJ42917.1 DUF2628 domain-containing protein [Rhodospirillaceae bacterium]MDP7214675.1 DUF2628 domain-containing protein [Rhodospirillales bacterium]HIJ45648.1 DUF2628 domain-containing protein [Rhodospirillaceae bacterium]HIJ92384.1 DUF2628 domain-containing protein [Rhodospirillaceae bacterium]